VVLWIADNRDPPAIRANRLPFRDRVDCVVSPFAVNVRPEQQQQLRHGWLGEDGDVVNGAKRGDKFGTNIRREDRPTRALRAGRHIVIHCNYQAVRFSGSGLEVADMAGVQQVETAVGERNRPPCGTIALHRLGEAFPGEDLVNQD